MALPAECQRVRDAFEAGTPSPDQGRHIALCDTGCWEWINARRAGNPSGAPQARVETVQSPPHNPQPRQQPQRPRQEPQQPRSRQQTRPRPANPNQGQAARQNPAGNRQDASRRPNNRDGNPGTNPRPTPNPATNSDEFVQDIADGFKMGWNALRWCLMFLWKLVRQIFSS